MLGAMGDAPGSGTSWTSDVGTGSGICIPAVVTVVVNGEATVVPIGTTVADVVRAWCAAPQGIAVARNREVVPRSEWAATPVAAHDRVEIVTAAAGG